ncbi:MAG: hypothetical protein Kow0090_19730 [Myxococcota bacterium]
MDTTILAEIWKERNRDLNLLGDAYKKLLDEFKERRNLERTDMSEVGCAVSYEDFIGLLVEFNETSGGAFILQRKPDFAGRKIALSFHPHPDHVDELKRLHGHKALAKIDDFEEEVRVAIVRELTDYSIWMCVFEFTESAFSTNSPRKRLFDLMKDSLIDRLSDTFL